MLLSRFLPDFYLLGMYQDLLKFPIGKSPDVFSRSPDPDDGFYELLIE